MAERIVINPLTRISGFLEIDVTVENHTVTEARTKGNLFRGFEKMLKGRAPFDAVYYTERICGICSSAHAAASSLALEDALGIIPSEQGRYLRDYVHGCEFLQNHIRHFYQYSIPDYVRLPEEYSIYRTANEDYRIPENRSRDIYEHYNQSIEYSRTAHEMLAVLGGKAPHNHGIFPGGITRPVDADTIIKLESMLFSIKQFAENVMLKDAETIAQYYRDYFSMGGGYGNLMTYGCFDSYKTLPVLYVTPMVSVRGVSEKFNPDYITEGIDYSWYKGNKNEYKPENENTDEDRNKDKGYTWIKAARYKSLSFETGPLARQLLSKEYKGSISAMDRILARVHETIKVASIMGTLLENIKPQGTEQRIYSIKDGSGRGLTDTTRGALGHWLRIKDGVIDYYQIITPSGWNISPRGNDGSPGIAEKALIGTIVENTEKPVELGRILRSFDPCVSCATHVYEGNMPVSSFEIL